MAEVRQRFDSLLLSDLVITDTILGTGSDANVYLAERKGTPCAAKRLHNILLEDDSPGGPQRLIGKFEAECLTWSQLRHPGVVQFFGVHLERKSCLPILVMEKMDTSLRKYLKNHSKEKFLIQQRAFVLRQVAQALAYLHGQDPPLVHHDLSTNNVLLKVQSMIAKVTDFGMSRAIQPLSSSRKSSIKGTMDFMPPEALQNPPRYDESLDVFSFGNVVISTVTHEWPEPGPPTRIEGGRLVAVTELQRRERYTANFTPEEKALFLPTVRQCLENDPAERATSVQLVRSLQQIEASLPSGSHDATTMEQLQHQLAAKEEECRQNENALQEKDEALRVMEEAMRQQDEILQRMATAESSLEDTKAAFADYGIEVKTWSDVPKAVKTLVDRWDVKPVSEVLQKPPTMSQLDMLSRAFIGYGDSWRTGALGLGISLSYCEGIENKYTFKGDSLAIPGNYNYTRCALRAFSDWLDRVEGTGDLPRTRDTVLKAFKTYFQSDASRIAKAQRILTED